MQKEMQTFNDKYKVLFTLSECATETVKLEQVVCALKKEDIFTFQCFVYSFTDENETAQCQKEVCIFLKYNANFSMRNWQN